MFWLIVALYFFQVVLTTSLLVNYEFRVRSYERTIEQAHMRIQAYIRELDHRPLVVSDTYEQRYQEYLLEKVREML